MATIWAIEALRKDRPNQTAWVENIIGATSVGGTPAVAGYVVLVGPDGLIDPSLIPPVEAQVYVNGTAVPLAANSPNFNNTLPAAPAGYTNVVWQYDVSGNVSAAYATSGTSVPFGMVTSGTNTGQSLIIGAGSSLTVECPGDGVIEATELATDTCTPVVTNISAPTHAGQLLLSQPGNASAVWADPQIQGLYPAGSTICPAPAYVAPTCIQPTLIGGATEDGFLENILITTSGELITLAQDQETDPNVLRFAATTGQTLVSNATAILIPALSIQPKVGATSVTFTFRNLALISGGGQRTHWQLLLNATLTGASFVNADPASNVQFDTSATSYTGGRLLDAGFAAIADRYNEYEFNFAFVGATPPVITLVFSPVTGNHESLVGCSFSWDEQATTL